MNISEQDFLNNEKKNEREWRQIERVRGKPSIGKNILKWITYRQKTKLVLRANQRSKDFLIQNSQQRRDKSINATKFSKEKLFHIRHSSEHSLVMLLISQFKHLLRRRSTISPTLHRWIRSISTLFSVQRTSRNTKITPTRLFKLNFMQ